MTIDTAEMRAKANRMAQVDMLPRAQAMLRDAADELDRLTARVAELEKGPDSIVVRPGGEWHFFDDYHAAADFNSDGGEHSRIYTRVGPVTHHPASKPEPEARS